MSRLLTPLAAVLVTLACGSAQADWPFFGSKEEPTGEIVWNDATADAFAAAHRSGRPILVYVTAEHCGYCRKMERETWKDPAVTELVAAGFVPLKLNADHHPDEVAALRVKAYPTTVLVSPQGKPFAGRAGFLAPEKLVELLQPAVATNEIRQPLN